jgi:single-strand DNA-binding protein
MASVNKVILVGNLGSDPEVRYFDGGAVVAKFNIATSEAYTNRNGERVEQTEWHRIEVWNKTAQIAEKYLKKGNQVYIEGSIRSETWTDKEGQQRNGITIRATNMTLLGGNPSNSASVSTNVSPTTGTTFETQPSSPSPISPALSATSTEEDELPF